MTLTPAYVYDHPLDIFELGHALADPIKQLLFSPEELYRREDKYGGWEYDDVAAVVVHILARSYHDVQSPYWKN